MTDQERVGLIRRGNELFNNGDITNALKIYLATNYGDGIIRVGDYYYFDKNDKISGVKLYKKAGHQKMVDDFAFKAAQTIKLLLWEDSQEKEKEEVIQKLEDKTIQEWEPVLLKAGDLEKINVKK